LRTNHQNLQSGGVARVPCALGQEVFLRPPQQKLRRLKRKIGAKSAKEAKAEHYCSYFSSLRSNKAHYALETNCAKL